MKPTLTFVLAVCFLQLHSQTFTKLNDPAINARTADWFSAIPVDFDNNYTLDLILGNHGGDGFFLHSDSLVFSFNNSENFVSQTGNSKGSIWADIDNDCDLDVFWPGSSGSGNNYLYENNGDGSFTLVGSSILRTEPLNAVSATWGDYDNDGLVDLYVARQILPTSGLQDYIFKNTGNFNFVKLDTNFFKPSSSPGSTGNWVDIDMDGDLDLFVANRGNYNNDLYINNGNGSFTRDTSAIITKDAANSASASWADFDNNGYPDLFITNLRGEKNKLYLNNGSGNFTEVVNGSLVNDQDNTIGSYCGDFDNDGYVDIFIGNNSNIWPKNNILYKNNGNGSFSKVTSGPQYTDLLETFGTTAADLNSDGFIDIITANRYNGPVAIYLNDGNNNGFLHLNLLGTTSNRSAIGARVVAKSALGTQTRTIVHQTGYIHQDDMSIKLGFGQDATIDSLIVYWPSGNSCTFSNVVPSGFYWIEEGTCVMDTFPEVAFSDSSSFLNAFFTNESTGPMARYHWDFGDGDTSDLVNPSHKYANPGTYLVTLTGWDNYCKHLIYTDSIEICPDTSALGFIDTHQGLSLTLTDTSISTGYDFQWDFGDGNSGSGTSATHTYNTAGTYQVCLDLTDSCRTKSFCRSISVCNDTLLAGFGATGNGLTINFNDSSVNSSSVSWTFGDGGATSNATNPTHTYPAPGYYLVCQTAQDICTSTTWCDTIGVCLDTAKAGFSYTSNGLSVNFSNQSQNAATYLWDFGNGIFSTSASPTYNFPAFGTYEVCLSVNNDCYTDSICQMVEVCPAPAQSNFSFQISSTNPQMLQFTDQSSDANSYYWDFGDGNTSSSQNPSHTYQSFGSFQVCLIAENECYSDTFCINVDLCPSPGQAGFSFANSITPLSIQFTSQSIKATSHHWDFGDGSFSTNRNPLKVFSDPIIYTVCLSITDSCGLSDTTCQAVDLTMFSTEELLWMNSLDIYPNPANDRIYIESGSRLDNSVEIVLYDVKGQKLRSEEFSTASEIMEINVANLPKGLYILNIETGNEKRIVKISKD